MKSILAIALPIFFSFSILFGAIINVPADQPTIQAGITIAAESDTVLVAPGTYTENISFNGKNITVASFFLTTQDTAFISQTVIDGNQAGSVVSFANDEGPSAILQGLTITNGSGTFEDWSGEDPLFVYLGGGIFCRNASPSLLNLVISNNSMNLPNSGEYIGFGVGVYCDNSILQIENVDISDNSGMYVALGSGIHFHESSAMILNSVIDNNTTYMGDGVGVNSNDSNLNFVNVAISNNSSDFCIMGGGAIYTMGGNLYLQNCLFNDNSAFNGSCIFSQCNSSLSLTNTTMSGNNGDSNAIALDNSTANLINCILWDNTPDEILLRNMSTVSTSYSCFKNGVNGIVINNGYVDWNEGNIVENPCFTATGESPFTLQDISPCVNAGVPDTTGLNLSEYDLAGNLRLYGGRIDIGAFENQNVIVKADENTVSSIPEISNYPNPFNPTTTISFSLADEGEIELTVYNMKGQKVKALLHQDLTRGYHSIVWNGNDAQGKPVSSGIYYYQLMINGVIKTVNKCVLLK